MIPVLLGLMMWLLLNIFSHEYKKDIQIDICINPMNCVQYYINTYGQVDINDNNVSRVNTVFKRVLNVADKRHARLPGLVIVGNFNHPKSPLAIALPDNHIVLSKSAIDTMYDNVSQEEGDTRVAFVLGHELTHLANNDFWHLAFFVPNDQPSPKYQDYVQKDKEKAADDQGFIYAALAGYPVKTLLSKGKTQPNFFEYWEKQAFGNKNKRLRSTHPNPVMRAIILNRRLRIWLDKLPFFEFGVRLSHFDKCNYGVHFFEEFSRFWWGREVYNNWGVCDIQRAQRIKMEMGNEAYFYWLPPTLDYQSALGSSLSLYSANSQISAYKYFKDAKQHFSLASNLDPSYKPAKVNLAITEYYLGETSAALATIEKALKLKPDDLEIQGLHALIIYERSKEVSYINKFDAIQRLDNLVQQQNVPLNVIYNSAQVFEQENRQTDELWQKLVKQVISLPHPIRYIVCRKQKCPKQQEESPQKNWDLPVEIGFRIGECKPERHNYEECEPILERLEQWKKIIPFKTSYGKIEGKIYQHPQDIAEILELGKQIKMVVLKKFDLHPTKDDLANYCGQPLRQRTLPNGTLWSCGDNWAALEIDEKVKEVWVVK